MNQAQTQDEHDKLLVLSDPEEPYDQDSGIQEIYDSMTNMSLQEMANHIQNMWETLVSHHHICNNRMVIMDQTEQSVQNTWAHLEYLDIMVNLCYGKTEGITTFNNGADTCVLGLQLKITDVKEGRIANLYGFNLAYAKKKD